jgi:hypothetical protein
MRRISTEMIERRSLGKHRSASVTLVRHVRNQRRTVLLRHLDQRSDLLLGLRNTTTSGVRPYRGVFDGEHSLLCMAVPVPKPDLGACIDLRR